MDFSRFQLIKKRRNCSAAVSSCNWTWRPREKGGEGQHPRSPNFSGAFPSGLGENCTAELINKNYMDKTTLSAKVGEMF